MRSSQSLEQTSFAHWTTVRGEDCGFGLVELIVSLGILSVLSLGFLMVLNNAYLGIAAANKGVNRTDMMKAISTALSDKETCKAALSAGELTIPTNWSTPASASIDLPRIQVGTEKLAEVGTTIHDIETTAIRLEKVAGPFPVRYNVAPANTPADLRNYVRYFAKLTVTPRKSGGQNNNTGGVALKDSEFRITVLVDDASKLHDCFGGMLESDLAALCEKAFDGEYDAAFYPWCKLNRLAVGMRMSDLGAVQPRVAIQELPNSTNSNLDATFWLLGAPGGNGPGMALVPGGGAGGGGHIGAAGQASRFGTDTQPGDLVLTSYGRDMHFASTLPSGLQPTRLILKSDGKVGLNTLS
ncbi:MAG: prepilin-type N-terminal cleavage/methylation domain-containing protein, partial [Bdellovibrionaceae bacterium]|nr:prepilin-type N-terminal cleavage/methylation domain-containing protein [Pseudobdellovibrionaceae bacterium]